MGTRDPAAPDQQHFKSVHPVSYGLYGLLDYGRPKTFFWEVLREIVNKSPNEFTQKAGIEITY